MAEWFVEEGIGEDRAVLRDGYKTLAAKIEWPGSLAPQQVAEGTLVSRPQNSPRGRARFPSGEEALVDRLPRDASEGATMRFLITRAAIAETGRHKLASARPTEEEPRPAPSLAERLGATRVNHIYRDVWEDIFDLAWTGTYAFAEGELTITPTPAMTLIDIDGAAPPRALAQAAIGPLARAIALLDLAGSIGIDFPTLPAKADRQAVNAALDAALADWDHERTAMNGFGFVQLVSRMEQPSLLHRIQFDRPGASARYLLRRAMGVSDPGAVEVTAQPAVIAAIRPEWQEEFARRRGVPLRLREDAGIALSGGNVQAVPL